MFRLFNDETKSILYRWKNSNFASEPKLLKQGNILQKQQRISSGIFYATLFRQGSFSSIKNGLFSSLESIVMCEVSLFRNSASFWQSWKWHTMRFVQILVSLTTFFFSSRQMRFLPFYRKSSMGQKSQFVLTKTFCLFVALIDKKEIYPTVHMNTNEA